MSNEYSASPLSAIEISEEQPDISSLWMTEGAAFSPHSEASFTEGTELGNDDDESIY